MEQDESTTDTWAALRQRITEIVLGKIPQFRREPLDVVDVIHNRFPEWKWLEIAAWMDGSITPTDVQRHAISHWVDSLVDPESNASSK